MSFYTKEVTSVGLSHLNHESDSIEKIGEKDYTKLKSPDTEKHFIEN